MSRVVPSLPAYRLLFVCMGNICRSPAGEGMMLHLIEQAGASDWISCDSAGTIGFHEGSPPDRRMTAAASNRGVDLQSRARQIRRDDFSRFDLILTMDDDNFNEVSALAGRTEDRDKVFPMLHFARGPVPAGGVPDPYYGGREGFERVLDLLEDACGGLLAELQKHRTLPA